MGIQHIQALLPEGFPYAQVDLSIVISQPDGNGVFSITGHDDVVASTDATHFQIESALVSDNGDGSYTISTE